MNITFSDVYSKIDMKDIDDTDYIIVPNVDEDTNMLTVKDLNFGSYTFSTELYYDSILSSYNYSSDEIWYQFSLDFPRTAVYVKNIRVLTTEHFKNIFSNYDYDLVSLLAMLCNQSSFVLPFTYCTFHFSEPDKGLIVTNYISDRKINIDCCDKNVSVKMNVDLCVKDISTDTDKYIINNTLMINIDVETKISTGIVVWTKFFKHI